MQFLNYLLLSLVAALGPVFGYVVSLYTQEEVKAGRSLIELASKLVLLALTIVILVSNIGSYSEIVIIIAIIAFHFLKSDFVFFTTGVLFFLCSFNGGVFSGIFLLIFLYFLIYGVLRDSLKRVILQSLVFLGTALIIYGAWWLF